MVQRHPLGLGATIFAKPRSYTTLPAVAAVSILSFPFSAVAAEHNFSAGVWGTYAYLPDDDTSRDTWGSFEGEALILYANGEAEEGEGRWLYSAETRFGPGSFTDPENNSTGDNFTLHQAWVGWRLGEQDIVRVGKSQVPFGWKTYNFWPGDILLAGFGDQMDVGVKLSGSRDRWHYDAALYLADDWGSTSTDTVDDNGHWGSSDTFRKTQTWVGNLEYEFVQNHRIGLSLQSGQLQDLTGLGANKTDGEHRAAVLHYQGSFGDFYTKASLITNERELPPLYQQSAGLAENIENTRYALELGYDRGPWSYYIDFSTAEPDTEGSAAGGVHAIAPGFRYNYGPGWVYVEYLSQNGGIDRNGQVVEGDFDALYITLDFYL